MIRPPHARGIAATALSSALLAGALPVAAGAACGRHLRGHAPYSHAPYSRAPVAPLSRGPVSPYSRFLAAALAPSALNWPLGGEWSVVDGDAAYGVSGAEAPAARPSCDRHAGHGPHSHAGASRAH